MRDAQLYRAIKNVRLTESERDCAVAAMETAERIAGALVWLANSIGNIGVQPAGRPVRRYPNHATQGTRS